MNVMLANIDVTANKLQLRIHYFEAWDAGANE